MESLDWDGWTKMASRFCILSMSRFPVVPVDTCPLCRSRGPLRESHIIPGFVFDWLLESSATGHMRDGRAPNLRIQDGFKQRLLCDSCEALLKGRVR